MSSGLSCSFLTSNLVNMKGSAFQKVLKCIIHRETKEKHLPALENLISNFKKLYNDNYLSTWLDEELYWKKLKLNGGK